MTIQSRYPNVLPSLLLDFANSKTVDPRVSFSRSSTATYYDGGTKVKAEENLVRRSQTFSTPVWARGNIVVTTGQSAPDGTNTAIKIAPNTNNIQHFMGMFNNLPSSLTLSVFAKAAGSNLVRIDGNSVLETALFNLSTGTVSSVIGSGVTASIVNYGNGWYRCIVNLVSPRLSFMIWPGTSQGQYVGNGTDGVIIWGAQAENRSFATPYVATTDRPITNYISALALAANNVPRIDHDPVTDQCRGLLIEGSRSNLITQSEELDHVNWSTANVTTRVNANISPAGTLTADEIVENSTNSVQFSKSQGTTLTANVVYTWSMYIKRGVGSARGIRLEVGDDTDGFRVNFNPDTGAVVSTSTYGTGVVYYGGSVDVGNGWRRYYATGETGTTTSKSGYFRFTSTPTSGTIEYTGDGIQSFYVWGAQLEEGTFPTSYIKTEASQVTRSVDSADITGANFTSFFNNQAGTIYAEGNRFGERFANASNNFGPIVSFASSATAEFYLTKIGSQARWIFAYPGTTEVSIATGSIWPNNQFSRVAASYSQADGGAVSISNSAVVTNSLALVASATQMRIGNRFGTGGNPWNGYIRKIAYYPAKVLNSELPAVSTP